MSGGGPTSDSTPFFSDESEVEGPEEPRGGSQAQRPEAEPPSGVSRTRALLTVFILCYVNLLNYMDRFTVAGKPQPIRASLGDSSQSEPLWEAGDDRMRETFDL